MGGGGGGWGAAGNLVVIVVRVCEQEFRNLPHSYTWPLKKLTYSYTWSSKMLTYSYTAFWLVYSFIARSRQISQSIHWIPREQAASNNLWSKRIYAYTRMSEKWSLSHTNQEKSGQSYTVCWRKKWANHIPGSAEKGGHSARTSVLCHI